MNRGFIPGVAIAIAIGGTALAQPAEPEPAPASGSATATEAIDVGFVVVQGVNELRLRDLRGRPIVNIDDEPLGGASDFVFDSDGRIVAVIVGVGGFLGLGEKQVAISTEQLEAVDVEGDGVVWVAQTSRDSLAEAPAFDPNTRAEPAAIGEPPFLEGLAIDQWRVADLLGRPIRNSAGEALGNVDDIVFSSEHIVTTAVVGVGGFLGIGEKRVGITFETMTRSIDEGGTVFWTVPLDRAALETAPAYMTLSQAEDAAIGAPEIDGDADGDVGAGMFDFAELAAEVTPAVVSVRVEISGDAEARDLPGQMPANPEGEQRPRIGQGSGFFISADGYIVTNNHVVADATRVVVALGDGSILPATIIGTDPRTDIALLKVEDNRTFPFVLFAEEEAVLGDWVLAVGNPYGLGGTVTLGIVSALGRNIGAGPYDDFMQIDAAINRGNSGGPSFNLEGQVIGVNTAIFSPTGASVGIGFATPAYIVADIVADLQDDGVVQRGWLGVQIQPIDPTMAEALRLPETSGAMIVDLVENAPADIAGLERGDVVLAVEDEAVDDDRDLARAIAAHNPGETVALTIWRDGEEATMTVQLGRLPDEENATAEPETPPAPPPQEPVQGIGLSVTTAAAAGAGDRGLAIVSVDPNGLAARTLVQPGDIILEADGQAIDSPEQLVAVIDAARSEGVGAVLLLVRSGGVEGYIGLPIGGVE